MISWWRDLRLSSKLGLCGVSFLVPIALLLFMLLGQMTRDLRLTRVETTGIAALAPLEDITEAVADHLRLTLGRLNGENVDIPMAQLEAANKERWAELTRRLKEDAGILGLTPARLEPLGLGHLEPQAFQRMIQELAAKPMTTPEQAMQLHWRFLELLGDMREYLADSASLVLDPQLASYYLMYLLVFDIPRAQERLGMLYAMGYEALAGPVPAQSYLAHMEQIGAAWEQSVVERILDKLNKAQRALGGERLAGLPKAVKTYSEASTAFLKMATEVSRGRSVEVQAFLKAGQDARLAGAVLWDQCLPAFQDLLAERTAALKTRVALALGVSLGSVAAAALLAWTIVTSITRPLARVAGVASAIAQGRVGLAARLLEEACPSGSCSRERLLAHQRSRSETNQLFAAVAGMIVGLEELLGAITRTGTSLQTSAGRIAATARQLEAQATQQAASTVQVGATGKQISANAAGLARTMDEVLGVANRSSSLAQEGRQSLAHMANAMEDLSRASREVTGKLTVMRERATGIGQMLSAIAKVAAQTNLLSLNAAIEAEKAGEFGPGFAVVAREIRRLADQTASAALDIERTVRDMQGSVETSAQAMEGLKTLAEQTSGASREVNAKLGRIIESGEELTPRISSVTEGVRFQAEGADQISVVISQLAENAGQTRDSLAEFRQAAEDLDATAAGLKDILAHFDLGR